MGGGFESFFPHPLNKAIGNVTAQRSVFEKIIFINVRAESDSAKSGSRKRD